MKSNVCVICHIRIPNKPKSKLIAEGYSQIKFVTGKGICDRASYFCKDHTPKEKADAIWKLMKHVDPYKPCRFENIVQRG